MTKHYNQGSSNSQFGTCWVCNDKESKPIKIKKEDLDKFLSLGWRQGRIFKNDSSKYVCQYCERVCKSKMSVIQHELYCKQNPNRLISYGNKGNMPEHTKAYYCSKYKSKDGTILDVTRHEIDEYAKVHPVCEICGKTIEESVKWESKYKPTHLCIDHDHTTNKFRGLLCSVCNRQLGWYEKYKDQVENYLNKGSVV